MKKLVCNLLAALAAASSIGLAAPVPIQVNTRLVSNLVLGSDTQNREIWSEGSMVYVARGPLGLDLIDASNQAVPVRRSTILPFAHARISDVQVIGNVAYLANEVPQGTPTPHVGMFIYDVSNPLAPVELSRLEWGAGGGYHLGCDAHSITVNQPAPGVRVAYLSSGITGDLALFDVSDPALPVYLSEIVSPVWSYYSQAHDAVVAHGRCYTTWLGGGFTVHDVNNPTAPVLLAHQPNANVNQIFTYHLALSSDGQTLLTTEEFATGADPVRVWNVSNPGAITLAASFTSPNGALPHQIAILGKYAYIGHLGDGLRILDISAPAAPRSLGWFDPDGSTAAGGFAGGYSVFPTANNIYLSHISGGLYVVDFVDSITITKAEWKRSSRTLTVEATSSAAPSPTLTVTGRGVMTYIASTGRYKLTQTGVHTQPSTITVTSDLGATRSSSVRRVN